MKKKIGCLHAHYSNIAYIENALASDKVELVHFVDPGLMSRISSDNHFDEAQAKQKVLDQIEWIAHTNVDAILITCTNYIALLDESRLIKSIPIIKMDEPFFHAVCRHPEPQILLFTNPATVDGTMRRLHEFAAKQDKSVRHFEARVIEDTFELIMQGNKEQYDKELAKYLKEVLASEKNKIIAVAQLSMVEAANKVEQELGVTIGNPLDSLIAHFNNLLLS